MSMINLKEPKLRKGLEENCLNKIENQRLVEDQIFKEEIIYSRHFQN